jgi:hypothetical protein
MPDIATPASSPARSSTWIEATVVPSDCASFACASTVASPERTGGAGECGHRVRHRLERRGSRGGELVREPAPDQPEPRDRVIRPLDVVGVGLGDHDAEVAHILGGLAQRCGVDA